jgi:predicted negative regulator of RcsB-dependent stress response
LTQHISRRELKTDEVRQTLAHGAEAVLSHQQLLLYLGIAAVVVALGFFGWGAYIQRQTVKASAAFDNAMKIFQTPVGAPTAPGEVTYTDPKKKFGEAEQKFAAVASQYPRTHPGELARYYAALSVEELGNSDDAKKWLQGLVGSKDEEVAALAQFKLAQVEERLGHGDEAVRLYRQLIAKPTALVPKPTVLLALAQHFSEKNPAEAAKLYGQVKSEYPDTPSAEQAEQALALLPGKS